MGSAIRSDDFELTDIQPENEFDDDGSDSYVRKVELEAQSDDYSSDFVVITSIPEFNLTKIGDGQYFKSKTNKNFYCFLDDAFREEYISLGKRIDEIIQELNALRKLSNAKPQEVQDLEDKLQPLYKEMTKQNEILQKKYKEEGHTSNTYGCKFSRQDADGLPTSSSRTATSINLTLKGLEKEECVRLRMPGGSYLELHFDKKGKLLADEVIPLKTIAGKSPKRFSNKDIENKDCSIYNDFDTLLNKDLNQLKHLYITNLDFGLTGVDVIEEIRECIKNRKYNKYEKVETIENNPVGESGESGKSGKNEEKKKKNEQNLPEHGKKPLSFSKGQ